MSFYVDKEKKPGSEQSCYLNNKRGYEIELHTIERIVGGFFPPSSFNEAHIPIVFTETRGHLHLQALSCSMLSMDEVDINEFSKRYSDLIKHISDIGYDWSQGGGGRPASDGNYAMGFSPLGIILFINYSRLNVRDILQREDRIKELGKALKSGYSESDSWFKIEGCMEYFKNEGGK